MAKDRKETTSQSPFYLRYPDGQIEIIGGCRHLTQAIARSSRSERPENVYFMWGETRTKCLQSAIDSAMAEVAAARQLLPA